MQLDKQAQNELYSQIGREIADKYFTPGPMARALQGAKGDPTQVQSLYIQYRHEELADAIIAVANEKRLAEERDEDLARLAELQARKKDRDADNKFFAEWGCIIGIIIIGLIVLAMILGS